MRLKHSRYGFIFLVLSFLTLTSINTLAQAAPVIDVQPISGPVGTTVTISDLGGNRGNPCYAQIGSNRARGIGTMAGSISYVVDSSLAAGTVISFWCSAGSSASARSNIGRFTVTPPVVVDTDGDGLPDSRDNCPNQSGPVDNGGCPAAQPVDSDGDGLTDDVDACPGVFGPRESQGCAPSPVPATAVPLPPLPVDGPCVVATLDVGAVNVRQLPTTDSAIVGALDPYQVYSVIGRNADFSWLQINTGWVAAFVTRQGGDCSTLPQTDAPQAAPPQPEIAAPEGGSSEVGLLVPAIQGLTNAEPKMQNCPELLPQVNALPTFLALSIINEADPCAAAQSEIDDLFFNQQTASLPSPLPDCNNLGGEEVQNEGITAFFGVYNQVPQATRDYLIDIANGTIGDFCLLIVDLAFGGITSTSSPTVEHAPPMSLAYCDVYDKAGMTAKIQAINVDPVRLYRFSQDCELYGYLRLLGSTTSANADFFNLLVDNCGIGTGEAGKRLFSDAIRGALDAASASAQGCAGFQLLDSLPLPPDLQPKLPQIASGDENCTGNFRLLATHNAALGMESLYRILKSVDPCTAAGDYTYDGDVPFNVVPPPQCIQGNTMTLGGAVFNQVVLDQSSSWFQKITALDRPQDELCSVPPGQGDGLGFAQPPSPTMGAFVANPTATLPVFVANPTATLPAFAANPTSTPEPGLIPIQTDTPTPELPEQAAPEDSGEGEPPAGEDEQDAPPAPDPEQPAAGQDEQNPPPDPGAQPIPPAPAGCFGCLPDEPLIPGGRVRLVMAGTDAGGNFAGLFALPNALNPNPEDASLQLIRIPLDSLPQPIPGSPVAVSPDGTLVGYMAQGVDPASLPANQRVMVTLPDATPPDPTAVEEISIVFVHIVPATPAGTPPPLEMVLFFPPGLVPQAYAPAWSDDAETLFVSLADAAGVPSIHALQIGTKRDLLVPLLVVANAFAPDVAPNGRYLAFERNDPNGRNIYALALNSLQENPITQQMPGAECYGPQFGVNSLKIYFTCGASGQQQMYRYGLDGITPINTGIEGAQNPRPGSSDGILYFDDGITIYTSPEDGSAPVPLTIIFPDMVISSYQSSGSSGSD